MAPLSQVRAHCQPPSDKKCQEYNSGKQHRRPGLSPLLLTSILLSMYVWDLQEKFDSFSANMSACQDKLLVRSSIVDEHVKVCPPRPLKEIRSFPSPLFLSSLLPVTQRSKNVPVSSLLLRLLSLLPSFPPSLHPSFPLSRPTPCASGMPTPWQVCRLEEARGNLDELVTNIACASSGRHCARRGRSRMVELSVAGLNRGSSHHLLVRNPPTFFPSHLFSILPARHHHHRPVPPPSPQHLDVG